MPRNPHKWLFMPGQWGWFALEHEEHPNVPCPACGGKGHLLDLTGYKQRCCVCDGDRSVSAEKPTVHYWPQRARVVTIGIMRVYNGRRPNVVRAPLGYRVEYRTETAPEFRRGRREVCADSCRTACAFKTEAEARACADRLNAAVKEPPDAR